MTKFKGKTVIVTGGSRDIGRAVSENLAAGGANVVVNYCNNEADGQATLDAIKAAGDVDRLVAETVAAFGDTIDILVNVTGGLVARKGLAEMDEEFFNHVMQLNVTSTFMMTQVVAPHMPEGGAILNFASQAGRDGGGPGAAAYATSKGAVMTFTRAMAKELGPKGIRVNSLCPGMIATAFHDTFTKDEVRTAVAAGTPLRRQGNTEEVARTVANLVSDDSSFITGANIDINGGMFFS